MGKGLPQRFIGIRLIERILESIKETSFQGTYMQVLSCTKHNSQFTSTVEQCAVDGRELTTQDYLLKCEKCTEPSEGTEQWQTIEAPSNLILVNAQPMKMVMKMGGNQYEIVAFVCKNKTAVVKRGRRWYLFNPKPNKVSI